METKRDTKWSHYISSSCPHTQLFVTTCPVVGHPNSTNFVSSLGGNSKATKCCSHTQSKEEKALADVSTQPTRGEQGGNLGAEVAALTRHHVIVIPIRCGIFNLVSPLLSLDKLYTIRAITLPHASLLKLHTILNTHCHNTTHVN